MNQVTFKKMAHVLRIIVQVLYKFCIVGVILGVIAFGVIHFLPAKYFVLAEGSKANFSLSVDGFVRYHLNPQSQEEIFIKPFVWAITLMTVVVLAVLGGIFRQVRDLLKTVEDNRPFAVENARRLTIIGSILIVGSVLYQAAGAYVVMSIVHTFNLSNLEINLSVDGSMLLSGCLILVLAGVFKYGNFLQEEYDSTL